MADTDSRLENLEEELKALKGEARRSLVDLRALLVRADSPTSVGSIGRRDASPDLDPEDEIMVTKTNDKPRVFISHSWQDKDFVERLAWSLRGFGFNVWYDGWEIAIGDSIVDKVMEGLEASDALLVVLSPASVESRWVKEELNIGVMRRISENDIRILPIVIETCNIPTPLKHIRFADFRESYDEGLALILDSLAPGQLMWQSLAQQYDHFCMLCDQILDRELDVGASDNVIKIHSLLESALNSDVPNKKCAILTFLKRLGCSWKEGWMYVALTGTLLWVFARVSRTT